MKQEAIKERRDLRPAPRSEDPRELAAKRAAEIRNNGSEFDDGVDEFACPPAPDGWTYEWKRKSSMNQEDHSNMLLVKRAGWTPVPVERHPEMMHIGAEGSIERKGMILMERPAEIVQDAYDRLNRLARNQVKIKEGQLASDAGLLGRDDSRVKPKIKKSYEPLEIPD